MTDSGITVVLAVPATARQAAAMAGSVPALRAVIVTSPHGGRRDGPRRTPRAQGPASCPGRRCLPSPAGR